MQLLVFHVNGSSVSIEDNEDDCVLSGDFINDGDYTQVC